MIITIGRECGCEADHVAELLSVKLGIPFYNKEKLIEAAKEKNLYDKYPNYFGEAPVNSLLYLIAVEEGGLIYKTPGRVLHDLFENKDFIIVGRASNYAFKDDPNAVKVFLTGSKEKRMQTIKDKHKVSERKAEMIIEENDARRSNYHNFYTGEVWGAAQNYDLCLCETRLGADETANCIIDFIKKIGLSINVQ